MEIMVEMHSNLSAAHFNERRAKHALKIGNVEEAIQYFKDAIEFMEMTRKETDEDDNDFVIIDLQLSSLKLGLNEAMANQLQTVSSQLCANSKSNLFPTSSNCDKLLILSPSTDHSNDGCTLRKNSLKLPKTDNQTHEELIACNCELRKLVDLLANELNRMHKQLSEERDRRLAIEAELLSSCNYNICETMSTSAYLDNSNGSSVADNNLSVEFAHLCCTQSDEHNNNDDDDGNSNHNSHEGMDDDNDEARRQQDDDVQNSKNCSTD